jgi:hypothetical protein
VELEKLALQHSGGHYDQSIAQGVHLILLPGATISLNASETLGEGPYGEEHFREIFQFGISARHGRLLQFHLLADGDICRVPPRSLQLVESSVRSALARIPERLVPSGAVHLYFMRRGPFFAKQVYAFRAGRAIELSLYEPCASEDDAQIKADALKTISFSMHELTHMIDQLYLRQSGRTDGESLADSAMNCVYEALYESPDGAELSGFYSPVTNYEDNNHYSPEWPALDVHESCTHWIDEITTLSGHM